MNDKKTEPQTNPMTDKREEQVEQRAVVFDDFTVYERGNELLIQTRFETHHAGIVEAFLWREIASLRQSLSADLLCDDCGAALQRESCNHVRPCSECAQLRCAEMVEVRQSLSALQAERDQLEIRNQSQAETIGGFISLRLAAIDAGVTFSWEETPIGKRAIAHNEAIDKLKAAREALDNSTELLNSLRGIAENEFGQIDEQIKENRLARKAREATK